MWTFDRYQRWIEQKKDWMRPASSATHREGPIEISIEENTDLAELAKEIERRSS